MDEIYLIKPNANYIDQIAEYRKEFLNANSSMDGCGSLSTMENPNDWLNQVELLSKKETVPDNFVQSTQFICVRKKDNRLVGMIQVRHYFNEFLEKFGGHIGYSVRPSERRKGYAKLMLRDCLEYCKEMNMEKVLVTCIDSNVGSRKTILANGGKYESTVFEPDEKVNVERYWITLGGELI